LPDRDRRRTIVTFGVTWKRLVTPSASLGSGF
jgi:hypothetical protein